MDRQKDREIYLQEEDGGSAGRYVASTQLVNFASSQLCEYTLKDGRKGEKVHPSKGEILQDYKVESPLQESKKERLR